MSKSPSVPITPAVLAWAMEEAGYTVERLADRLGVGDLDLQSWLDGEDQPTLSLFRKLAGVLRRPSAVFLLPGPPAGPSIAAAFRNAPGTAQGDQLTPDEAEAMRLARRRQMIASSLLQEADGQFVEIPSVTGGESVDAASARLRDWLGVTLEDQYGWESDSQAQAGWREAFEAKGLLVFLLSIGEDQARGFSVLDRYAPLIAANTTGYSPAARIFTFWHELGHLTRSADGVCERYYFKTGPNIERWCERFAAAGIMPRQAVLDHVREKFGIEAGDLVAGADEARSVARRFRASLTASAIRLINLRLAQDDLYARVTAGTRSSRGGGGGGEQRAEKRLRELGHQYTSLLVEGWIDGRVPLHDAVDFLDVRTTDLGRLEELLASSGP